MASNPLDKVYLTEEQLATLASGGSITSGGDTYSADEDTLYLTDDTSVSYEAQTLTDAQKTQARTNIGAGTSNFSGDYDDLTGKPTIPSTLAELTDDSTHRVVTDTEKNTWTGKQDVLTAGTNITIENNVISATGGDVSGVVKYSETQQLTNTEKARARANIGIEDVLPKVIDLTGGN